MKNKNVLSKYSAFIFFFFSSFFSARKSGHAFPNIRMESNNMIENFKRVYVNDESFDIMYLFNYTNTVL